MLPAISINYTFDSLRIGPCDKEFAAFGTAKIVGNRRTWKVVALDGRVDLVDPDAPDRATYLRSVEPEHLLFEAIRIGLHQQCRDDIAERLNRAVSEQGGYAVLFGEDEPSDPFQRGRDAFQVPDRVWNLAA